MELLIVFIQIIIIALLMLVFMEASFHIGEAGHWHGSDRKKEHNKKSIKLLLIFAVLSVLLIALSFIK